MIEQQNMENENKNENKNEYEEAVDAFYRKRKYFYIELLVGALILCMVVLWKSFS